MLLLLLLPSDSVPLRDGDDLLPATPAVSQQKLGRASTRSWTDKNPADPGLEKTRSITAVFQDRDEMTMGANADEFENITGPIPKNVGDECVMNV